MKLAVTSLAAERGGCAVFDGVSFAAEAARCCVTGANGCWQTTLLRILAGSPRQPLARCSGWRDATLAPAQAASYVGHANAFNDALTVRKPRPRRRAGWV